MFINQINKFKVNTKSGTRVEFYSPDVERNGHHGVEHDDVSPEAEEASVGGALVFVVEQIPGIGADLLVPEGVPDSQTCRH